MAYVDGQLAADRATQVAQHLVTCAECKPFVSDLRLISEKLAEWQVERAPRSVTERITSTLAGLSPKPLLSPAKLGAHKRRTWVLGLALASALFLLLVAIAIPNLLRPRMAVSPRYQQAELAPYLNRAGGGGGGDVSAEQQAATQTRIEVPTGPIIVRTGSLTLYANDFEKARSEIEFVIRRHRGYAGQVNVTAYAGQSRAMRATFRVPTSELDATLSDLKRLGRVVEENITAEEVTRQYVDLQARLSNAQVTEQRLRDILGRQAGRISDILAVEREIGRVRQEIETMVAEQKNLEARIQYAALSVTLYEESRGGFESAAPRALTRVRNAVTQGYRGLSESFLALIIFLLSYGPAILFWAALAFFPARFAWRRFRRS